VRRRPRVAVFDWGLAGLLARSSRTRRRLLERALRSAAAILSPSPSMRERLLQRTTLDPERVHVVELGGDAAWFAPTPAPRGDTVLAVGKDMARDYATFGEAMRRAGGAATVVAEPRNLVGLELPETVTVRRGLPWPELRRLYDEAGCVVVAIRREDAGLGSDGSGLTALLEAMTMGAPIVATRRAAIADYVEDGTSALLVPAEDPPALAEAITRVREDAELAAALGRAARETVERRLTTRHLAERLAPIVHAEAARL
jgi:glycosyltransferase involved in cell wall biosynthesis